MSTHIERHPNGYCVACGRPKDELFDFRCHACTMQARSAMAYYSTSTSDVATDETIATPVVRYEGKCESCGGSVFRAGDRSLHSCPIKIAPADKPQDPPPALRVCDFEEITADRAGRIYTGIYNSIWRHRAHCEECDRYARTGLGCEQEQRLWAALAFWRKYLPREQATYGTL